MSPGSLTERDLTVLRSLARRIDPADPGAHNNLGVLYYERGLFPEAIAAFAHALELDPRMTIAQQNLELVQRETGYYDRRVAELREQIRREPQSEDARLELGRAYVVLGHVDRAFEEFRGLRRLTPSDPFNFFGQGPRIDDIGTSPIQVLLGYISPMMLSLILFLWMPYARMTNSIVISLKNTEFIHASRALGSSSIRTVFRHIIPNSLVPSVVLMARDVGGVIILQATLTFIQLGGDSPWGDMLSQGRSYIINGGGLLRYWWV